MVWQSNGGATLWVGAMITASQLPALRQQGIRRVLCLGTAALPSSEELQHQLLYLAFPSLLDMPSEDLLSIMPEACAFIDDGLVRHGHGVLVHCIQGQSRSAAVAAACLIQNLSLPPSDVLQMLQRARSAVSVNAGFVAQLDLWYRLCCASNVPPVPNQQSTVALAQHCGNAAATVRWWQYAFDKQSMICGPPNADLESPLGNTLMPRRVVCFKCRHTVCQEDNVIDHRHAVVQLLGASHSFYAAAKAAAPLKTNRGQRTMPPTMPSRAHGGQNKVPSTMPCCTSLFLEPLTWCLKAVGRPPQMRAGTLHCPAGCGSKIGAFDLDEGLACGCGTKVRPAFQLMCARVELKI